ncbi:hypothetical protein [Povalibacter sp.]|uniref:hypothetical protein n=1 Tax=Povalibacter sp. TaxID=1962978 RepID=UPI002F415175
MRGTFPSIPVSSRPRLEAVFLALVLGLWLVAYSSHVHARDDHGSLGDPSTACSFCVSLPAGATPPTLPVLHAPQVSAETAIVDRVPALRSQDVPSFYLSRGPPAH